MISIPVDPPPETYPDSVEHRSQIARYSKSVGDSLINTGVPKFIYVGEVTTTASTAFTLFPVTGIKSSDIVFLSASNSLAGRAIAGLNSGSCLLYTSDAADE